MTSPTRLKYLPYQEKAGNTFVSHKDDMLVRASSDADYLAMLQLKRVSEQLPSPPFPAKANSSTKSTSAHSGLP